MGKGPGLYSDIGKKTRDLLYKDYQNDHKFTLTTYSPTGVAVTATATKKGDFFLADVNTQLKNRNVTTDIKVDASSNLLTTVTVDDLGPGLKAIFNFKIPDQRSGKVELQCLNDHFGVNSSLTLTANPVLTFAGVIGTNALSLGADISFDTKAGDFTKMNAGASYSTDDLISSLALNDKGHTLVASYYHVVRPLTNTAVGGELTHSFSTSESTITFGTQHALNPLTLLKARVDKSGKVGALIQHEWRPRSLFTVSAEVDTWSIEKTAKVGLALALKP